MGGGGGGGGGGGKYMSSVLTVIQLSSDYIRCT